TFASGAGGAAGADSRSGGSAAAPPLHAVRTQAKAAKPIQAFIRANSTALLTLHKYRKNLLASLYSTSMRTGEC
ncbi:hypothetical protein, partial [Paenibacillus validus]|uniref:hypothetical protein n=1 Tax=Paenibacillus validus TaxID=44253 RepID=UPI002E1FC3BE|nr:hypothetical protein [Paenibacillus validus]